MIKVIWNDQSVHRDTWIAVDDISLIHQSGDPEWVTLRLKTGSTMLVKGKVANFAEEVQHHMKKHH